MRRLFGTAPAALAAAALAFAAGFALAPRPAAGGPQPPISAQVAAQPDYVLLQNRVAALEKSLAGLQQQHASHTHRYNAPRGGQVTDAAEFIRGVMKNPNSHPGLSIQLMSSTVANANLVTSTSEPNR